MKAHIVTLASVILTVGAGAAYAANETVTLNAIDANGVGKEIGTLRLSDTKEGLEIMPGLAGLPPGDHGFHVHVNPNCGPGNGPNGQPAAVISDLAHTGVLRAGINLSNFLLVTRGNSTGDPEGVAPDLAGEVCAVSVKYVTCKSPGELADAIDKDVWDIGLIWR